MTKKRHLLVDTSNLLFRVAVTRQKFGSADSPEEQAGLAMHMALNSLLKQWKTWRPDEIALTFEGGANWRKTYTKSSQCKSNRVYKANRVYDNSLDLFIELIKGFEQIVREHTNIICLGAPTLEGDDVFAAYVQEFKDDEIIGVSGDKDFVQLLKYENFRLIDPETGKDRTHDDPHFFLFEKCFRGDPGDNVMSAYPRVRKTRLQKAFTDPFELTNLLNETWSFTDPETNVQTVYSVKDLYEENRLLMDLSAQPAHIRKLMQETVVNAVANRGTYSFFHFTKFCGKYNLKKIVENASNFSEMLSGKSINKKKLIRFD